MFSVCTPDFHQMNGNNDTFDSLDVKDHDERGQPRDRLCLWTIAQRRYWFGTFGVRLLVNIFDTGEGGFHSRSTQKMGKQQITSVLLGRHKGQRFLWSKASSYLALSRIALFRLLETFVWRGAFVIVWVPNTHLKTGSINCLMFFWEEEEFAGKTSMKSCQSTGQLSQRIWKLKPT